MAPSIVCRLCSARLRLPEALAQKLAEGSHVTVKCPRCGTSARIEGVRPSGAPAATATPSVPPAAAAVEQKPPPAGVENDRPGAAVAPSDASPAPPAVAATAQQGQQAGVEGARTGEGPAPAERTELPAEAAPEQTSSAKAITADAGDGAATAQAADKPSDEAPSPAGQADQPAAAEQVSPKPEQQPADLASGESEQPPSAEADDAEASAAKPSATPEPAPAEESAPSTRGLVRDLDQEAARAGVFDTDELDKPARPRRKPPPRRKAPPPPSKLRAARRESQSEEELDFEVELESLSALSAPLDLRAPDLSQLAAAGSPPSARSDAAGAGKWVLHPPLAALTTSSEQQVTQAAGPLSAARDATGVARDGRRPWQQNPLALGLIASGLLALVVGVWAVRQVQPEQNAGQPHAGASAAAQADLPSRSAAAADPNGKQRQSEKDGSTSEVQGRADSNRPGAGKTAGEQTRAGVSKAIQAGHAKPKQPAESEPAEEPEKPKAEARTGGGRKFDRGAAVAALRAAAANASTCRRGSDPSGMATVIVTFASSGRAINANVSGPPFAGTATGGCIAAAMRRARVPAFSGPNVTVSKRVVIR